MDIILVFFIAVSTFFGEPSWATPSKAKTRVIELFIWKVSDTLELKPDEESRFAGVFRGMSEKKSAINEQMEKLIQKMPSDHRVATELVEYRKLLDRYNRLEVEEFDSIRKILGEARMARYLVLKSQLTQKLKEMLSAPSGGTSGPLKDPKVIE